MEHSLLEISKETLGRLAYKGILEYALSFRESDLNDDCTTKKHCTKMGFVYKEHSKKKIKQDHTYWFLHKTFQEYLAAFHLTEKLVKRQEWTVNEMMDESYDNESSTQVFKFVSGIWHKKHAVHHRGFVEKVSEWIYVKGKDKEQTLDFLCANILSECSVDKYIAGIIRQYLPESLLFFDDGPFENVDAVFRIMPRLLHQICTKDGVNREVYIDDFLLSGIVISASELTIICEALMEKLKVRKLEFVLSAAVDDDEIVEERHCNYGYSFTTKSTKILAKALCQNCNLKELYFNGISLPGVDDIIAALTSLPTDMAASRRSVLHTLVLCNTRCHEKSAFAAAKMLRSNNTLKRLEISWCSLGSKGVTSIAEALELNRTLNCLRLTSTGCGDKGVAALADMLRCNQTLTELFISNFEDVEKDNSSYNKVGDDGAVALAGALRVNNSLKKLHLCNNNITDEGFKCLAEICVKEDTALKLLCIDNDLKALDQDTREKIERMETVRCLCIYDGIPFDS